MDVILKGISESLTAGTAFCSPLARSRILSAGLQVSDCWATVKYGTPQKCREPDRLKFIDSERVVFVALSEDKIAILVSGFKLRKTEEKSASETEPR